MQFAYQFPDRLERLVLVDSGGLGEEVSLALRAATLPGAEFVLPMMFSPVTRRAGRAAGWVLWRVGMKPSANMRGLAEGMDSLGDADARRAFVHTARSVIDPRGQRVDARDRLYLSEDVPTMLIWGESDPIIPVDARPPRPRADAAQPLRGLPGRRALPVQRRPRAGSSTS